MDPVTDESTPPADPAPPAAPPNTEALEGPVYLKKPPLWTYFLTPVAVVIGAALIAGAVWLTADDDDEGAVLPADAAGSGAAAMTPATSGSATATAAPANRGLLDTFNLYAKNTGLDQAKFSQCLAQDKNVTLINSHLQRGSALGVTGTPTFFINNKKLVGAQPTAVLNEIIDAELKGSPTTLDGYSEAVKQLAAMSPPAFQIMPEKPDVSDAPVEGNRNAKVMIAEFSDFQCPFCKRWNDSSLNDIRARLGNDIALAFLHFPIQQIHPNAANASLVAICAGDQGKFWEMHDLLFARQAEWSDLR